MAKASFNYTFNLGKSGIPRRILLCLGVSLLYLCRQEARSYCIHDFSKSDSHGHSDLLLVFVAREVAVDRTTRNGSDHGKYLCIERSHDKIRIIIQWRWNGQMSYRRSQQRKKVGCLHESYSIVLAALMFPHFRWRNFSYSIEKIS